MCGGTRQGSSFRLSVLGLSPRVRGNRARAAGDRAMIGSIPACAGEPGRPARSRCDPGVYPRVCGGTSTTGGLRWVILGLSPRVRGNHLQDRLVLGADGSIPACAGEPSGSPCCTAAAWVYPRVCGGTFRAKSIWWQDTGLSPRVRGNRSPNPPGIQPDGSIPACAGEPVLRPLAARRPRVYPRVCGGTDRSLTATWDDAGLSPRVRGNPAHTCGQPPE